MAFAVNDTTTSPANLIVTAATSNSTLLPSGNLTLGGSGTNRTVSFRPASNQSGTANITVTVSDGQLTSSDTFVVNVTAVNDAPTISNTSDKVISQNSSTGPIPVTIGDVETAAGSLQLTAQSSNTSLVPQSGLVMGGSGANRTVTVTPAANQSGQATITLQVSDGTLVATDTFIVTVQAASTSPSTSQPTYLLAENFEAPGYENPGWFEVGNPDDYYSRVRLEGLYALRTQLGAQAYRELGGAANAHLSFMFVWRESTANHTILDLSDNTGNPSGFVWATPGQLHLSHGDATVSAPFSYALNTRYYIWVDWAAGTGANGVMSLYISGSSTKPATPLIRITNGNGLPAERIYFGGAAPDSPSIAFDMLKMSDGPLPAN